FAAAAQEAAYVTVDLWKTKFPTTAAMSVLTEDEYTALSTAVFSVSDTSVRNGYILNVNARDASAVQEERKQELIAINQFLFSFYDRLSQLAIAVANPQLPPPAKKAMLLIAERMERGVEALLASLDSIPNPSELLVKTGEFKELLDEAVAIAPT